MNLSIPLLRSTEELLKVITLRLEKSIGEIFERATEQDEGLVDFDRGVSSSLIVLFATVTALYGDALERIVGDDALGAVQVPNIVSLNMAHSTVGYSSSRY